MAHPDSATEAKPQAEMQTQQDITDDVRRQALQALMGMQPALEMLGESSGSHRVKRAVHALRQAVQFKLDIVVPRQLTEREAKLMEWAASHNVRGDTPFEVQGNIIKTHTSSLKFLAWNVRGELKEALLSPYQTKTAGYRALKACVWGFDPSRHGDDFWAFAEPFVTAAIRHCLHCERVVLMEQEDLQTLVDIRNLDPALTVPPAARGGRRAVSLEQNDASELHVDASAEKPARLERNIALTAWAGRHQVQGWNVFTVQGSIIRSNNRWAQELAFNIHGSHDSSTLSPNDRTTAAYRVLKCCAVFFNPLQHGEDFQLFAEPYLQRVLTHCAATGTMDIPEQTTLDFLLSLGNGALPSAHLPVQTTKQKDQPPAPAPVAELPQQVTPDRPAEDAVPRQPQPDHPALSPEEDQEHKRRRRLCRWAKDEHNIQVHQEQFEQAVEALAEKHHPLAKGVVERIPNLNAFRGGKSAVRREAYRLLPERIRTFDPAGGEHFTQFVTVWLEANLKEFVAGNGKRRTKEN